MNNFKHITYMSNGRSSKVYKAFSVEMNREVVLKVIDKKYTIGAQNEVNILSTISNSSVPRLYEYIHTKKYHIIVMDLCNGQELFSVVNGKAVELTTLKTIFTDIAKTMASIHKNRIVHRDLKLENIIIGKFNYINIVDWGMAMVLPIGTDNCINNKISGTKYYISPEVLDGGRICFANDVWAFGVMIMICLKNIEPFLTIEDVFKMRPIYDGIPVDIISMLKKIFVPYTIRITFAEMLNEPWFK